MLNKIYNYINRIKDKNNTFIFLIKFIYGISWSVVHTIINVILTILLGIQIENGKFWMSIFFLIALVLLELYFSFIEGYKKYKNSLQRNADLVLNEITSSMIALDDYINDKINDNVNSNNTGIFEYSARLVSESLYKVIKEVTGCEVRISIIQQFHDNKGRRHCSMISRKSKKRTSCLKKDIPIRYTDNSYYYLKILSDNNENTFICENKKEIDKCFFWANNKRKSNICQYIGIAQKINTADIAFLLQIDGMEPNAFGKDKDEIEVFVENYVESYVQFLKHAYNTERVIVEKGDNNE